jgi:hypothetical protein
LLVGANLVDVLAAGQVSGVKVDGVEAGILGLVDEVGNWKNYLED